MTILVATNNPSHLNGEAVDDTTAGRFDDTVVNRGLKLPLRAGGESKFVFDTGLKKTAANDIWYHWECYITGTTNVSTADGVWFEVYSETGSQRYVMDIANGALLFTSSNSMTPTGSFYLGLNTLETFDLHTYADGTEYGAVLYRDGNEVARCTRQNTSVQCTPMINFRNMDMVNVDADIIYSQIIIADGESTIGMKVMERPVNVAGHHTDWQGAVTDLDNNDPYVGMYADAAGDKQSWTTTDGGLTIPSGYQIHSVNQTTRFRKGASGPQSVENFIRAGGVDYPSGQVIGGAAHRANILQAASWETNPNNGNADWASGDLTTLEMGLEAKA